MKKVLIAVDSFKGSISSAALAEVICEGLATEFPTFETVSIAVSDGGEGMVNALARPSDQRVTLDVSGPMLDPVRASYSISEDGTAVMEMASAAGMTLLDPRCRNPWLTTTFGVGQMVSDALRRGCRRILLGIGGSVTNDAGIGMMQALGYRFLDAEGCVLGFGGRILERLDTIDDSQVMPEVRAATFTVACDVDNPLFGPSGAAVVFAPQKGADAVCVERLDRGLRHFAEIVRRYNGVDLSCLRGGGAAGGLGAGMVGLLGATLKPGMELILDRLRFDDLLRDAVLVITGEGQADRQTLMGKVPYGVLKASGTTPVVVVAGRVEDRELLMQTGFAALFEASPRDVPLDEVMHPDAVRRHLLAVLHGEQFCRLMQSLSD